MTLIATRIHKAQAALARIHGNRYIANEEYLKKAKDVTGAHVAIEEAMAKMGALTGPDPGECKLIGKLVKAAMQIVESIFVKMWEVRTGHSSLYVLETDMDLSTDVFRFHWEQALRVMEEVKMIVLELVRRIEADEKKAVAALENVKEDMTTAITSLEYVQTAIKSNNPPMSKILIDLDMTEQLVMRLYEELFFHAPALTIDGRVAEQELPFTPMAEVELFGSHPTLSVQADSQAEMDAWDEHHSNAAERNSDAAELHSDALTSPAPP